MVDAAAAVQPAQNPPPGHVRRFHLPFMHWPRVRRFNERFFPTAGIVSPFVLAFHHVALFWWDFKMGFVGSGGWASLDRWMLRTYAVYVIIQGGAAIMRPTRQAAKMIRDIVLSTIPLFPDAIVVYAHYHDGKMLSSYQWAWIEGDFWFVLLIDVVIFSLFMAEIDFYQAPIYRQEAQLPPPGA